MIIPQGVEMIEGRIESKGEILEVEGQEGMSFYEKIARDTITDLSLSDIRETFELSHEKKLENNTFVFHDILYVVVRTNNKGEVIYIDITDQDDSAMIWCLKSEK